MHGLINKAIEAFVTDTYGKERWLKTAQVSGLEDPSFEAMMVYDPDITRKVVETAAQVLGYERADFLQNLGTYLVSFSPDQSVRRLLRFGGVTFVELLYSLDDLRDRARLAVSDLDLPEMELREHTSSQFSLTLRSPVEGFGHVMIGLLTAMADDYGSLVMLEHGGRNGHVETVSIALLEATFAEGKQFDLAARL